MKSVVFTILSVVLSDKHKIARSRTLSTRGFPVQRITRFKNEDINRGWYKTRNSYAIILDSIHRVVIPVKLSALYVYRKRMNKYDINITKLR